MGDRAAGEPEERGPAEEDSPDVGGRGDRADQGPRRGGGHPAGRGLPPPPAPRRARRDHPVDLGQPGGRMLGWVRNRVPWYRSTVPGSRCQVHGARFTVPGSRCQVHGARFTVPGSRCQVHGARFTVPGSRCQVHGARFTVPGSRCQVHGARSTIPIPGSPLPTHAPALRPTLGGPATRAHRRWRVGGVKDQATGRAEQGWRPGRYRTPVREPGPGGHPPTNAARSHSSSCAARRRPPTPLT